MQTALDRLNAYKRATRETRLKHAKLTFFRASEEEVTNSHLLQLVFPDKEFDQINNPPSLVGMINSLPVVPLLNLPQSILATPIRTIKVVKGHLACLSIDDINRQLNALSLGPYPVRQYDGYGDYDALRDALVVSFMQQYNMGLVIRPIRFGKREPLPVFIERINFDLQTCLYRIKSSYQGII